MATGVLEIAPVNKAQAKVAMTWLNNTATNYKIFGVMSEHTPNGNIHLDSNTLRVCLSGPIDALRALKSAIELKATNLGLTVTVSKETKGLVREMKDAVIANGTSIANRPALKSAVFKIWREHKIIEPKERKEFFALLKERGFNSKQDFIDWLNQT